MCPRDERFNIARDSLLHGHEWGGITGLAQRADVGLGIALIFAREFRRERYVLDYTLALHVRQRKRRLVGVPAAGVDGRDGNIVEALCGARPHVEDARLPR